MNGTSEFDCGDKSAHISSLNKTPASILKEYAEKNKMVLQYNLIYNGCFQSTICFKYSLTLDEYKVVGDGPSKKEAKQVAASNMLKKMIDNDPQLLSTEFKQWDFGHNVVSPFDNLIRENSVGKLIKFCSDNKLGAPKFNFTREEGKAHAKLFTISCQVGKMIEYATHKTKRQAKLLVSEKLVTKLMYTDKSLVLDNLPDDSERVLERVEAIKANLAKNAMEAMEKKFEDFHLQFKRKKWSNTDTLDSIVEKYRQDGRLNISDPEDVLNKIVQECEMIMEKEENITLENGKQMYILQIENVYPPVFGMGQAPNNETAKKIAINNILENFCILYL